MDIKKILFALSSISILTLTSCGGSGLKHTRSVENKVYSVDLNHNGKIDSDEEQLTWIGAYDKLIKDANSMQELNKAADEFKIAKTERKRTSLARYEILHQAEELLMSTGAIMPLYNYGDPYLLKPNITGAYTMNLGYKFFDQLHYTDGSRIQNLNVSVGTKAETFDPASNSDVSTCLAMNQFLIGANRYKKGPQQEGQRDGVCEAVLGDGVCVIEKKIVTSAVDTPEGYIPFNSCPDLKGEDPKDYEGTARYTITLRDGACWNDGTEITADDFIYEWTRASSGVYNGQGFGVWCEMFDMIRGYKSWNLIGQQTTNNPDEWDEDTLEKWNNQDVEKGPVLTQADKNQWFQSWDTNGCAGGMAGVMKNSDKQFTVQLINDCDYFEPILAFTAFAPVAKKNIILPKEAIEDPSYEKTHICSERGDWWLNKQDETTGEGSYLTNGPFQIDGEINNFTGKEGGIKLKKAEHCTPNIGIDDCLVDKVRFYFIDKDTTIKDMYMAGTLQLINQFPSSAIAELAKTPDWCVAQQLGLFFYGFNVNDNTFDIKQEKNPVSGERNREKLRLAADLLVNRYDIAVNVAKKGCTPANGYISDGIIETCIPEKVGDQYVAAKNPDGTYKTANWHDRNKNMFEYLHNDDYEYNNHIMSSREGGGFYDISYDPDEQRKIMEENSKEAIKLAKEAGVDFDENTGKFINFPRIIITTNNGSGLEEIAERLQGYYGLWGINVTIQTQEWQSFTASRRIGDFACAREGWVADYNDPRTYLDLCVSTNGNNDTQLGKDTWHDSH